MFKPTKAQISAFIGGTALIGIVALLAYAAVFFSPSKQPIGYIAQPTLSNYNLSTGGSNVYRGEFYSFDWSGRFDCYPVGTNGYVDVYNPCFLSGASSPLDTQAAANGRYIGTFTDTTTPAGVGFTSAALSTAQVAALGTATGVNWIRGTSLSPSGLRARTTVLGDIIHSRPYYYSDGTNPTVFVGANDGMLHAFNATSGQERWAYVPSMLISSTKMGQLPTAGYTHDYFVDGSMTIANIGTGSTAKTILVGALGAGGKGLYALNISAGTGLTATSDADVGTKALWEITNTTTKCGSTSVSCTNGSTSYADLGYTYSNPVVVPTPDGKDSVIVGNGYNNTGNGHAVLYIINAQSGQLIQEVDTGSGSTTSPNGLSTPTVIDVNKDGKADRVYAGDINGNMWVFDWNITTASSWTATLLYATNQPYTAAPATSVQAITQAPAITPHPNGGFMVNFATGRILSDASATVISPSTTAATDDTTDTTQYYAYGLWDNLKTGTALTISTSQLISQTITPNIYPSSTSTAASAVAVRSLTTDVKPNWATNRGWMDQLPLGGDRVTGDGAFVDNGKFQFNVTNPTVAYSLSSTLSAKGLNWLYQLDFLTGGAGTIPFLDLNRDGSINDTDRLMNGSGGTTNLAASGIPVAYATSNGLQSQPILIQLGHNRIPLFNQNFNVAGTTTPGTGVNGGHFDVDVFYNTGTLATAPSCTGGTLSADGTACVKGKCTGGSLSSSGNACATIPAQCTGGILNSGGTACAPLGTYVPVVAAVSASCLNGTLNAGSTACLATTFTAAICTNGTLNSGKTACLTPTYTAVSCSNGGVLNAGKTACLATSFTAASCSNGGVLNAGKTACLATSFTAASCSNGGVLNAGKTACLATSFTAASCSNGGILNAGKTACLATSFTAAVCTNATLNAGKTACLIPVYSAGPPKSCSNGGVVSGSSCKATTFTAAVCTNATLNAGNTACLVPALTAASCTNATINGTNTACLVPALTAASCTNATINGTNTACLVPALTAASCTNATINGTNTACLVPALTAASCTNGTLNSGSTACLTPGFTAATCANGTVNGTNTACVVPSFTPASPATAAQCLGGTLNSGSTACTAPGTFVAATTPGTYSTITPVGTYTAGGSGATFKKVTHVHEYDKIYDTNGLNPLNPNDQTYPLSKNTNMTSTTPYKVLVMNQGWNRAMNLRIGTWSGSTRDYQTGLSTDILVASAVSGTPNYTAANCANTASAVAALGVGCLNVSTLPSFTGTTSTVLTSTTPIPMNSTTDTGGRLSTLTVSTTGTIGCMDPLGVKTGTCAAPSPVTTGVRASVGGLELAMPNDGFNIKNWWKDGDNVVQTGVTPITPSCAYGDTSTSTNYPGLNGERHDGVLTVQLIATGTPNSAVQMNVPGKAQFGFRVIDSLINTYVLAEYTLYWHHPNAECMGDTQTWATTNNPKDPWWPAQETTPSGFSSSTANSTSTTVGILTCVTGGPSNASGGTPTWNTTALLAANTNPYAGAGGTTSGGPAGWTISPPQDSATTLPICPTYTATRDDPRTASFIDNAAGTNGSNNAPDIGGLINLVGGSNQGSTAGTGAGGSTPTSGIAPTSSVQNSGTGQTGTPGVARRITWRELIGL